MDNSIFKNILIIYPHWPPSNLAGVHRPRLIANFAKELGWQATVLTVKADYYEEEPDSNINKLVSPDIRVVQVDAFEINKKWRLVGDIGLRGFWQLYREALEIIKSQRVDFVWIPIPSFYTALLGRLVYEKTKTPYGIDYIDPWVDGFTNYQEKWSRAWLSNQLARFLEPIAVKKASLISGVSTPYYQPVLTRNFSKKKVAHVGMPYGFDPKDHAVPLENVLYPWREEEKVKPLVYAGAFLPKSRIFVDTLFKAIKELKKEEKWDESVVLYFLGTGNYTGKRIEEYALEHGISSSVVEVQARFPFLEILNILSAAFGVLVIGSTEKHYTASKTFQALLSGKPVFAVFHEESTAVKVLEECQAADYLVQYSEKENSESLLSSMKRQLYSFFHVHDWQADLRQLEKYSAKESARQLFDAIQLCMKKES